MTTQPVIEEAQAWVEGRSRRGFWSTLFTWLPYFSLLRVVLLASALLCLIPVGLFFTPTASLLRGLFDLRPFGIAVVTMLLTIAALSLMVITYLTLINGGERCRVWLEHPEEDLGKRLRKGSPSPWRLLFFGIPLPMLIGIWLISSAEPLYKLVSMAIGVIVALLLSQLALLIYYAVLPPTCLNESPTIFGSLELPWLRKRFSSTKRSTNMATWYQALQKKYFSDVPPYLGQGYFKYDPASGKASELYPGQVLAIGMSIVMVVLYLSLWGFGQVARALPALSFALVLVLLLCWLLAGIAFFLDRYRWPLLRLIIVWGLLTSLSSGSDYYYPVKDVSSAPPLPLPLVAIDGDAIIVVAANGGGIQSAAWTAQVLTGIERQARTELGPNALDFDRSIRFISSVSGGSVGTMHVVNAYSAAGLPAEDAALDEIVDHAATSSIADMVWGLAYPDLMRSLIPNPFLRMDRGRALEDAWSRADERLTLPLSSWRAGVGEGWRPATVFNATIAETGERLLFSTTRFTTPIQSGHVFRLDQLDEKPEAADVSIATAARLSATFPYVTPAARAESGQGELSQYHIVDGGYYDNYGMVTLVEWLDQTLKQPGSTIKRVLVLQVRGAPGTDDPQYNVVNTEPASAAPCPVEVTRPTSLPGGLLNGWLYQISAPFATMLHVRNTGQAAHNNVELELLQRTWQAQDVTIQTAVFQYYGVDSPLSWHLTEQEKTNIKAHWAAYVSGKSCFDEDSWGTVKRFLQSK